MDKDKLSDREKALLAEARREASALKASPAAARAPLADPPAARPAPTAAERLAELMAEERAQTAERKRKMRRYGLAASGSILVLFLLWVLRAFRRR